MRSFRILSASSLILRVSASTSTEKRRACDRRMCDARSVSPPSPAFLYRSSDLSAFSTSRRSLSAFARISAARSSLSPVRLRQKKKHSSAGTPIGQTKIMRPA